MISEHLLLLQTIVEQFPELTDLLLNNLVSQLSSSSIYSNFTHEQLKSHLLWTVQRLPPSSLSQIVKSICPCPISSPYSLPFTLQSLPEIKPRNSLVSNSATSFFNLFSHTSSSSIPHCPSFVLASETGIVSASRVHPPSTLNLYQYFDGHQQVIHAIIFDHFGRLLITGSEDKLVKIWDVYTGFLRMSIRLFENPLTDLAISADNILLAMSDCKGFVHVVYLHNGIMAYTFDCIESNITRLLWLSPLLPGTSNQRVLCVASEDGSVRLYHCGEVNSTKKGSFVKVNVYRTFRHVEGPRQKRAKTCKGILSLTATKLSTVLVTAAHNGTIAFYSLMKINVKNEKGEEDPTLLYSPSEPTPLIGVYLSRDDRFVAGVYKDCSVVILSLGLGSDSVEVVNTWKLKNNRHCSVLEGFWCKFSNRLFVHWTNTDSCCCYVSILCFTGGQVDESTVKVEEGVLDPVLVPSVCQHSLNSDLLIVGGCKNTIKLISTVDGSVLSSAVTDPSDPIPTVFCQVCVSRNGLFVAAAGDKTIGIATLGSSLPPPPGSLFLEQFGADDPYFSNPLAPEKLSRFVSSLGFHEHPREQPVLCDLRFSPYKEALPCYVRLPFALNLTNVRTFLEPSDVTISTPFWAREQWNIARTPFRFVHCLVTIQLTDFLLLSNHDKSFGLVINKCDVLRPSWTCVDMVNQAPEVETPKPTFVPPKPPARPPPVVPDPLVVDESVAESYIIDEPFIPDPDEDSCSDCSYEDHDEVDSEVDLPTISAGPRSSMRLDTPTLLTPAALPPSKPSTTRSRRRKASDDLAPATNLPPRKRKLLVPTMDDNYSHFDSGIKSSIHHLVESSSNIPTLNVPLVTDLPNFDGSSDDNSGDHDSSEDEFMEHIMTPAAPVVSQDKPKRSGPKPKPFEMPSLSTLSLATRTAWSSKSYDLGFIPQVGDSVVYIPRIDSFVTESCRITLLKSYISRYIGQYGSPPEPSDVVSYHDFLSSVLQLPDLQDEISGTIVCIEFEIHQGHYPEAVDLPLVVAHIGIATPMAAPIERNSAPKQRPSRRSEVDRSSSVVTTRLRSGRLRSEVAPSLNTRSSGRKNKVDPFEHLKLTIGREVEYEADVWISTALAPPFPFLCPSITLDCRQSFASISEGDLLYFNRNNGVVEVTGQDITEFRQFIHDLTPNLLDWKVPSWALSLDPSLDTSRSCCHWLGSSLSMNLGQRRLRRVECKVLSLLPSHISTGFNSLVVEVTSAAQRGYRLIVSMWDIVPNSVPAKTPFSWADGLGKFPSLASDFTSMAFNAISRLVEDNEEFAWFVDRVTNDSAPGYDSIVPVPSYSTRIITLLQDSQYRHPAELKSDIERIAKNAELYNGEDSELHGLACRFRDNLLLALFRS
ncbi:hypothetical protein RCL1_001252 [Eukaryota sp. TZLM3-RCL]